MPKSRALHPVSQWDWGTDVPVPSFPAEGTPAGEETGDPREKTNLNAA
jgi:hypothetical protein